MVTTTVSLAQQPRGHDVDRGDGDDVVAVDDAARCGRRRSAGRRRRRARCRRSAPWARTASATVRRVRRSAGFVDVRAVGFVTDHDHVGADALEHGARQRPTRHRSRRRRRCAAIDAVRPSSDRHDVVDVVRRCTTRRSARDAIARLTDRAAAARRVRRSIAASTSSESLVPPVGEQLDAVVPIRVVRGRHHRAHRAAALRDEGDHRRRDDAEP